MEILNKFNLTIHYTSQHKHKQIDSLIQQINLINKEKYNQLILTLKPNKDLQFTI